MKSGDPRDVVEDSVVNFELEKKCVGYVTGVQVT